MSWYKEWFDRDEYELVYAQRDEPEAEQVIDLLERVVAPSYQACVLDVGCGRGRHARTLARRGYQVTGIDLSSQALAQAQRLAQDEGLSIRFIRQDMRMPVAKDYFDGVVNLFTAFGYFEEDANHLRTLEAIVTALKPGGWFFQDFLNAPFVKRTLVPETVTNKNGLEIEQRRWIERGRINKSITLRALDGSDMPQPFLESVRLLTLDDFRTMYEAVGLELVAVFGDYAGNPYGPSSPRLLLYSRKRCPRIPR